MKPPPLRGEEGGGTKTTHTNTHSHTHKHSLTHTQTHTRARAYARTHGRTHTDILLHIHSHVYIFSLCPHDVPASSPLRGGDAAAYVLDINQPNLPTLFYSVLVSISVFMALSTVFHSINSPDKSLHSHSVLPVLFLPYWPFQLYISL